MIGEYKAGKIHQLNGTSDKHWAFLSYGLFFCLGLVILATFLNYGLTYDEEFGKTYGQYVLRWYSSFFKDQSALGYYNLHLYGGLFEAISQLTASVTKNLLPIGVYELRHLVNALFGFLGILAAYKLGTHVLGPKAGFFSALFLAVTPGFYGQMFNDSKDIPFAALFSIALYYILLTYRQLPRIPYRLAVELGVAIGLALGVRIGGVVLLGYLAIFWMGWLSSQSMMGLLSRHELLSVSIKLAGMFVLTAIIAWTVMLVWWPWAQVSPLSRPFTAMKAMAHFRWPLTVFFNGDFLAGAALPWTYLPTWLLISLPEFYFISLALGLWLASRSLIKVDTKPPQPERLIKVGLLVLTVAFPISSALILHPTMYDGLRQFLFILPSTSALAAISFASFLNSGANKLKLGVGMLTALSVSLTILDMVQLHPYQYVYFNRLFAGGLPSAAKRFETDYWGSSYREGAEWVVTNYRPNSGQTLRVANCEVPFLIKYVFAKTEELRRRFVVVKPDENPDIYLSITRWQCDKVIEGRLVHTVERNGTPLLYVIEVQGSYRPEVLRKMAKGFSW